MSTNETPGRALPCADDDGDVMLTVTKTAPLDPLGIGAGNVACGRPSCLGRGPLKTGGFVARAEDCECARKANQIQA